jgi:hypothetical protein
MTGTAEVYKLERMAGDARTSMTLAAALTLRNLQG